MRKTLYILLVIILASCENNNTESKQFALIPQPTNVEVKNGSFELDGNIIIIINDSELFANEAQYLQSLLKDVMGKDIKLGEKRSGKRIEFSADTTLVSDESYKLNIASDKVTISARNGHGAFYAIQTLRQLLPPTFDGAISLPALNIEDSPAFGWRGMHLDVSRHFFGLEYLKKHIDRLAFYKFNKFHLHLTDDEGWRIEIKQYPKLTEVGAWRTLDNKNDAYCIEHAKDDPSFEIDTRYIKEDKGEKVYGGYYTQEEIKDLIAYAQVRHVEIIPEVDMPGHMMAAIKAYPFLVDGNAGWGEIFSTPICPCRDEVYTFTQNVLSEIADLFPSKYIHIGADEVDKTIWGNSPYCKAFMKKHSLKDVNKLQSFFVHQMQDFLEAKGKTVIAWDEILEEGTNPNVTVMYWRRWEGDAPMNAVNNGNEVIMTPTNPLYFDYPNTGTSAYDVYNMDIIFPNIPEDKKNMILGAQANTWSEVIPTEERVEFQMYPRMLALAERVWTNNTSQFDDFQRRLLLHYPILDAMGVKYRLPDIEGFAMENVYVDSTLFLAKCPLTAMKIHYTLDGSIPSKESTEMISSISISTPTMLKMALFSAGDARSEIYTLNFKPSKMMTAQKIAEVKDGLVCRFYDGSFKNTLGMIDKKADENFVVSNIKAPKETKSFGLIFDGYIDVPETGIYSFYFTCDDGGMLYIDNKLAVDNDGLHSPVLKSGQAAMVKGLHSFKLDFVEGGGGHTLRLQYSVNGSEPQDIPDGWFKYTEKGIK